MNRRILSAVAIFFGSMLLFGVQPMVGRTLLPFFGGTSAVWIVCLCAFQVLLLGGYFYAHRLSQGDLSRRLKSHLAILAVAAVWAFCVGGVREGVYGLVAGLPPAAGVLAFLCVVVGLPYVALSANSSLVQSLVSRDGEDVYHLYAVSNVGSLVGLFLYPFVLEPFVAVAVQWRIFGVGLAVYAALLWWLGECGPRSSFSNKRRDAASPLRDAASPLDRASFSHPSSPIPHPSFLWLLLPAVSCAVLNAVTAHLTMDVIAMPLLWCVLLALFLLSYVIGFSAWCVRLLPLWDALALVSAGVLAYAHGRCGSIGFAWHMSGGCGLVLFGCSALHVRLYRARPGSEGLTRYYLFGAVGGAVGGVLTGLVAPLVFTSIVEYPVALILSVLCIVALRDWRRWMVQLAAAAAGGAVLGGLCFRLCDAGDGLETELVRERGFFGTVRVTSQKAKASGMVGEFHEYFHGTTKHGEQFLAPGYELRPTTYYVPLGGGLPILGHPKYRGGHPMRVGIVGMGAGVTCAYGRTNDVYRCWEISPEVMNVATNPACFTYVSDSKAKVEPVLGDARLALERERREDAPKYDVLQIDAFSGDSVPYHLSTKEAFQLYLDRLEPDGFLSVHISNWHMDLRPLVKAVVMEFGVNAVLYLVEPKPGQDACAWCLFVKTPPEGFTLPQGIRLIDLNQVKDWTLPTDERGSLVDLVHLQMPVK